MAGTQTYQKMRWGKLFEIVAVSPLDQRGKPEDGYALRFAMSDSMVNTDIRVVLRMESDRTEDLQLPMCYGLYKR